MDNSREILQIEWFKKYIRSNIFATVFAACLWFPVIFYLAENRPFGVLAAKSIFIGLPSFFIFRSLVYLVFFIKYYRRFHAFEDIFGGVVDFVVLLFNAIIIYLLIKNDFLVS
jgi:hypothetical protein